MFLWTLVLNSSFLHRSVKLDCKAIYIHKICICNVFCHFTRQCITTQFKTSQNIWENFFSFTDQSHLFNSKTDRLTSSALILLKLSYIGKKRFAKSGSFTNFWFVGSRNWSVIRKSRTLNSCSARCSRLVTNWELLRIDFDVGNESITEPLQKKKAARKL